MEGNNQPSAFLHCCVAQQATLSTYPFLLILHSDLLQSHCLICLSISSFEHLPVNTKGVKCALQTNSRKFVTLFNTLDVYSLVLIYPKTKHKSIETVASVSQCLSDRRVIQITSVTYPKVPCPTLACFSYLEISGQKGK